MLDGDHITRKGSFGKCLNAARRVKGHKMFALKNGGECLSSPGDHSDFITKYEKSDECKHNKGEANAMNVYLIIGEGILDVAVF